MPNRWGAVRDRLALVPRRQNPGPTDWAAHHHDYRGSGAVAVGVNSACGSLRPGVLFQEPEQSGESGRAACRLLRGARLSGGQGDHRDRVWHQRRAAQVAGDARRSECRADCRRAPGPPDARWLPLPGHTLLTAQGRTIEVVNQAENGTEDSLADLPAIVSSFCARLYGQRRAKHKTEVIVRELESERESERKSGSGRARARGGGRCTWLSATSSSAPTLVSRRSMRPLSPPRTSTTLPTTSYGSPSSARVSLSPTTSCTIA